PAGRGAAPRWRRVVVRLLSARSPSSHLEAVEPAPLVLPASPPTHRRPPRTCSPARLYPPSSRLSGWYKHGVFLRLYHGSPGGPANHGGRRGAPGPAHSGDPSLGACGYEARLRGLGRGGEIDDESVAVFAAFAPSRL